MIELDHVIVAVRDLDTAATRFERDYGLTSIEGGRHKGLGTGNRIVPLGRSYVELMAVVDESESSPLADWVRKTAADGDRLGALCLRTDDAAKVAARLGAPALDMSRVRPDGTELRWKLAGLDDMLEDSSLPFFIQWYVDASDRPGAASVEHRSGATGIEWVELAVDDATLRARLGGADVPVRAVPGEGGVLRVGIATPSGTLVLD